MIKNKKLIFLLSFGHCGIDWVHSLLNTSESILILPELSFFRYWKLLGCSNIKSSDNMLSTWMDHFNNETRQSSDVKFFHSQDEEKIFYDTFEAEIEKCGIGKRDIFYSIHQAYAKTKKINIENIDIVVSHEHVSFPFEEIIKEFNNSHFLFVLRDPRASFAGYFRGFKRKFAILPDYYDYYTNMVFEEWMNTWDIWKKYSDTNYKRFKIIKNEDLVKDLEKEMRGFSDWAGIKFTESLLKRTLSDGSIPLVDSNYINKSSNVDKDFFSPKNVRKRWMIELSDKKDILMIESLFSNLMKKFGYNTINHLSFFKKIIGVYYFLLQHRGPNHFLFYKPNKEEFIRFSNRLRLINKKRLYLLFRLIPTFMKVWIIWFNSFINHFIIYFFPGNRWDRYDNKLLEETYRNYGLNNFN